MPVTGTPRHALYASQAAWVFEKVLPPLTRCG